MACRTSVHLFMEKASSVLDFESGWELSRGGKAPSAPFMIPAAQSREQPSPQPLRLSLLEALGLCEQHCSPELGEVQQGMSIALMGRAELSSHSRADL